MIEHEARARIKTREATYRYQLERVEQDLDPEVLADLEECQGVVLDQV
jgi:hypothetical protein